MFETSVKIVKKAEQLALSLTSGPTPVGRNVLLGITSDFLTDPRPDQARLRRTVEMIASGSGGHLKRGGGYGEQVKTAAAELVLVLKENLADQELKTLLGWTARLLLVRRVPGQQPESRGTSIDHGHRGEKPVEPAKNNPVLSNVLLKLDRGMATAFRGDKAVAACRPEALEPEIFKVLKSNKKGIRADVEMVKLGIGSEARIVGVTIRPEAK